MNKLSCYAKVRSWPMETPGEPVLSQLNLRDTPSRLWLGRGRGFGEYLLKKLLQY